MAVRSMAKWYLVRPLPSKGAAGFDRSVRRAIFPGDAASEVPMRIGPVILATLGFAAPAAALELRLSGFYDLNRPASLDYDPDFCGLWIAN
jgi:hypothetical protein